MQGSLALVGGDEFQSGCQDLDLAVLETTKLEKPAVLILPTAAAHQNPSKAAANGIEYFSKLGADATSLMVLDPDQANESSLVSQVESAQVVYITGGDPKYLITVLRSSLLLDRLIYQNRNGMAIIGSSAGAMVMAAWIRYRNWVSGLELVPGVAVMPHHERYDPDQIMRQMTENIPENTTVLGIDAQTGCMSGTNEWTVLGPGKVTVYSSSGWQRYKCGGTFSL
jgi:cyanophycinase